jgi:glycogen(starch) synthase
MLMPSRRDSLPLVALEAALMARPLVATRVGGLPEIVVHEQTGILVEPEHADDLARALTLLLEHPDVAERIGHAARRHVLKTFGFERQVEAYDMLYQRLTRKE